MMTTKLHRQKVVLLKTLASGNTTITRLLNSHIKFCCIIIDLYFFLLVITCVINVQVSSKDNIIIIQFKKKREAMTK